MTDRALRLSCTSSTSQASPDALREDFARHLKHTLARDRHTATRHDQYMALALATRDRLIERWIHTQQTHHRQNVKRVYYLSLEYLTGRSLGNNVINLGMEPAVREAMASLGLVWEDLRDEEVDAGLGNGGLGRLAACFMESLATMELPAMGYGLRYDYGIFRQHVENGYQVERPDDWLRGGNPWDIPRPDYLIPVRFGGRVEEGRENGRHVARWVDTRTVLGMPYDFPVVGYGGCTVNTLRLWSARSDMEFGLREFQQGDYIAAVQAKVAAESLTKVLYPNDMVSAGRDLRLRQEYFFVACSLHDILRRFRIDALPWSELPARAAIQLNDTHPALAVPELMRLLVDEEGLPWEDAWDLTVRTFGYTNHTLMSEALERWPVAMVGRLLPRHLQIIYEINRRLLDDVAARFPHDTERRRRVSLIEEGPEQQVRMANLAITGSHATNGVSAIHSDLVKHRLVPDFYALWPERFQNKTNGVTQRRWLLKANPLLAGLITEAIGDGWITALDGLERLVPLAEDAEFRRRFTDVKRRTKIALANYLNAKHGYLPDPASMFDIQVKRLHEYKRQLLNVLGVVVRYNRLRRDPGRDVVPHTWFIGGKAAPAYELAKLTVKLVSNVGAVINNDPAVRGRMKVHFVPDYRVSLAERLIPAANVSQQISTAGTEASGTGNMKFMLNGAMTVGTLDGANVEMAEAVGPDNIFIFGLTAPEVESLRPYYDPRRVCAEDIEIRDAVNLLFSGCFNADEPGIFDPIRQALFDHGDRYMVLADLRSYLDTMDRVDALYRDPDAWARKAILNVAQAGRFSSDRTIAEYARDIWHVQPCPIGEPSVPATLEAALGRRG
jgi:starch phosphorylase